MSGNISKLQAKLSVCETELEELKAKVTSLRKQRNDYFIAHGGGFGVDPKANKPLEKLSSQITSYDRKVTLLSRKVESLRKKLGK